MDDNDLREMFRRRESDVRASGIPPERVRHRTRRRQAINVLVTLATVMALVAVPLIGMRIFSHRTDRRGSVGGPSEPVQLPTAPSGFRSAALPYASIAYPDSWYLTDTSPLTWYGIAQPKPILTGSVLQLSNFDPNLHDSPWCMVDNQPMPDNGVVLSVGVQAAQDTSIPAPTKPWPVELGPYPSNTDPGCPEAVNLITSWIAPSGAYYWASAALAKNSSEADRSALKTAFASLLFPPTSDPWMSTFAAEQGQGSPRLVLDTATFQGVPLSLVVYLDHYKSPWIGVSAPIGSVFGGSAIGVGSGSGPPPPIDNSMSSSSSGAVVYGDASLDVVRAAIKTAEGKTFPATIVQVPTTVGIDRNAVWGFVDGPTQRADAIGYDANGNLLGNPTFATAPPDVIATGNDPIGGAWTLSITHDTTGDGLAFAWGTGAGGSGCCLGPQKLRDTDLQLDGTTTGGGEPSVVTAFASTSVTRVVAKFPVGSFDGQLFPFPAGYMGPAQVVVAIIPARVSLNGQLIAYDAAGNELVRVPLEQPACC